MNDSYVKNQKIRARLDSDKEQIEEKRVEIRALKRANMHLWADIDEADQKGDKDTYDSLMKEKQDNDKKLKEIEAEIKLHEDACKEYKEKMERAIEHLRQDPEFAEQMDNVLMSNYHQKALSLEKENEGLKKENEDFSTFKELAEDNEDIMEKLTFLRKNEAALAKLYQKNKGNEELSDDDKATEESYKTSIKKLRDEIEKLTNGKVDRSIIDKVSSFKSINDNIKSNNNRISKNGKDAQIYRQAKENIRPEVEEEKNEEPQLPAKMGMGTRVRNWFLRHFRGKKYAENMKEEGKKDYLDGIEATNNAEMEKKDQAEAEAWKENAFREKIKNSALFHDTAQTLAKEDFNTAYDVLFNKKEEEGKQGKNPSRPEPEGTEPGDN